MFLTLSMVTGNVAPEELVENAISSSWRMLAKWMRGEILPRKTNSSGRLTSG